MNDILKQTAPEIIMPLKETEKTDSVDHLLGQASVEENLEKIPELIVQAIEINNSLTANNSDG